MAFGSKDTDLLYVEVYITTENNETSVFTSVPSFLAIYIWRFLEAPENIKLKFVRTAVAISGKVRLRMENLCYELTNNTVICKEDACVNAIRDLRLPIYAKECDTFVAGICAVCREIIGRQPHKDRRKLLGFKSSCLQSPAESSIWTRFCEVDVVKLVNDLLNGFELEHAPVELVRFEKHINEPVRMHNIYKKARELANLGDDTKDVNKKRKILIECTVPKETLLIEHRFAEGLSLTVADLILYPLIYIVFQYCNKIHFPLLGMWINEVESFEPNCLLVLKDLYFGFGTTYWKVTLPIPDCESKSLYKADPKRYKPRKRVYTSQPEVDTVLFKLKELKLDFSIDNDVSYGKQLIDWNEIDPSHAQSSSIPPKRLERKRQQLVNMANAVTSLAKDNDRIIDFCSGTGHLAILLALKLPKCKIIIVENKPFSLSRAKKRASELKLKNCRFYQCNIDYFVGSFNIGASLHACGTATDIVIQQCRRVFASFVCCPCCYGSLQTMPHIKYPLSNKFRSIISDKDYLYIAHSADQTHGHKTNCKPEKELQGRHCMSIIDTDRKLHAVEYGYNVILTRLSPEKCTPKNHLLIGKTNVFPNI